MDQLRASDLYRFKQQIPQQQRNFLTHKQKIKSIMNRSTQQIRSLTQSQTKLMQKNKLSHQKALKWKHSCKYQDYVIEKQRQLNAVNNNFISRIYQNDQRRNKIFSKEISTSRSQVLLAARNFTAASARGASSRVNELKKDNLFMAKKLNEVRSTISCKDFHKQYQKHSQRSSSMSKFKIDARSFKFIPKNEILLQKISRVKSNLSVSSSKLLASKLSQSQSRVENKKLLAHQSKQQKIKPTTTSNLIKLSSISPQKKLQFKNLRLQKLNTSSLKQMTKVATSRDIANPEVLKLMKRK